MNRVTLKNGRVLEYASDFDFDKKFLAKINVEDEDGIPTGCWFYLHPDDFDDYHKNDAEDDETCRIGVMANSFLATCWALVPYRMMGNRRPIIFEDDYDAENEVFPWNLPDEARQKLEETGG
jgi:hypothetical protein